MQPIMRNSAVLVQRISVVLLVLCAVTLGFAGSAQERPEGPATIAPQSLLRPVTVYELKLNDLPSDMTVTIVKRGSRPAEIQVELGRGRYEAPEGNLAAFPAKIREHVERMFGIPSPRPAEPR